MSPARQRLLKIARFIHVYFTLFGLALLVFFAVTGFILNHEDWFGAGTPHTRTATGVVPTNLLGTPDKLAVVELLRKDFAISGAVNSFEEEEENLRVVFSQPGRRVEAVIQRDDGKTEVTYESRGVVGIFTDLHRGKSTGRTWGLVIDAVCVLVLIVATTGLTLWSSLRGRGHYGLLVIGLGLTLGVVVYFAFVP